MKRRCTQKNTLLQVIKQEGGKFCCKADDACKYTQDKLMPGNFKRHILKQHPAVFSALDLPMPPSEVAPEPTKKKSKKLHVDTTKENIILGTLQLATVNHLPYSFPEMVGFKTLLDPLYKAAGLTVNRNCVANMVNEAACRARELISKELQQQPLIAIEVDGASRGSRHFVGINARVIVDGKVIVRNLG